MYTAKIVTNSQKTLRFGYEYGILFDIKPLSGMSVDVSTSQGLNQIGVTVESQTVSSIKRTISGIILDKLAAKQMEKVITPFTSGKLYVNDAYFCEFVVQKSPEIEVEKNEKITFTMQILCPVPYWNDSTLRLHSISAAATREFSFPVIYDSHRFGTTTSVENVNVDNSGDVSADYSCTFAANADVENYGILNALTLKKLQFADTLQEGEKVLVYKENGRIKAVKEYTNGVQTGIIGLLTDDSYLFELDVGDNFMNVIADTNKEYLNVSVSFYPQYTGVIV